MNYYETRVKLQNFNLDNKLYHDKIGMEVVGFTVRNIKDLVFLHIKSLNVVNVRMPYSLPQNSVIPLLGFISFTYDADTKNITHEMQVTGYTSIFKKSDTASTLDRFIELLNDNIDNFIKGVRTSALKPDCKILYGHFLVTENKLQFKYIHENLGATANKISVLCFNQPFVDNLLKYFDIRPVKIAAETFYYIRPVFYNKDFINNFEQLPAERTVTAYRDTTEFFFPTKHITITITHGPAIDFAPGEQPHAVTELPFNLQKSEIPVNKYILLANKDRTVAEINFRLLVGDNVDPTSVMTGEAEIIVLRDMFDQFNMFRLSLGYAYSEEEYRELSYRKLMGITANTVYLQNAASTELLTKVRDILAQHLPDTGGNQDKSLWQSIRDLVGDRETLEEIYNLLYHAYPCEPYGPQSKKIKIEF